MSQTSVSFDSSTTTGDPASYDWDFGDGTAHGASANPSHTFQYPGPHHVTLTVTATDSSESAVAHDVVVENWLPTAEFATASPPRLGEPVAFSNDSFDLDSQAPPTYQWTFGDGATSTSREPAHKYDTPGQKTVTLTVTDDRGATASVSHAIDVADDGVHADITFGPANPGVGEAVSFDGHASSAQLPLTYQWKFDDDATSTTAAPVHTFATPGDHKVELTVTSGWGVVFTTSATVPVKAPPSDPGTGGSGSSDPGTGSPGTGAPGSGDPGTGSGGSGSPGSGNPGAGDPNPGGGQAGGPTTPGTSQPGPGSSSGKPKPGKKTKCSKHKKGKSKKHACVKKHGHKGGKHGHKGGKHPSRAAGPTPR